MMLYDALCPKSWCRIYSYVSLLRSREVLLLKWKAEETKGSPCKLKGLEIVLLVNISAVGFVRSNLIHLRNVSPRPKGISIVFYRMLG